jgi:CelD/BcsL family acetyltransferase involved in cellulose biosynthesis
MNATVIETWNDFNALEPEWNALLERSQANTIFLTWEWMKSWSEVVETEIHPFLVTVRDQNNRLIGIAPFYISEMRFLRLVKYKSLRVMGDYPTGAEYGDWIIDPAQAEAVCRCIIDALLSRRRDWDCIWMPNVSGWTGARERIFELCRSAGWHTHARPVDFGYFSLPDSWDAYLASLSPKKRHQVRHEARRIAGSNPLCECTSPKDLPRYLDALFELHYSRWSSVGQQGSFRRKPREAIFYRTFTPRALQKGWLRLLAIEEDSTIKAIQIGYSYAGVFHSLQEGFDPTATKGIGNVLRARVIARCIEEQLNGYDFLGTMSDHKRRWGAEERLGWDFLIGHPSLKNRLLFSREIWPTGRYLHSVNRNVQEFVTEEQPISVAAGLNY